MTVVPHERVADQLDRARRSGVPCAPPTGGPDMTVDDAYRVQQRLVALRSVEGNGVAGHKIGLTSLAMQRALGVDSPDYGPILSEMISDSPATLPAGAFIAPRVEAEIALLIRRDIRGPGVTAATIHDACAGAVAALEIIDSRIADWRITLCDTIADLASIGAVVLSSTVVPLSRLELRTLGMHISVGAGISATGAGAATLGDPLRAAAWLVNTLAQQGQGVSAGQIILTGALHAAIPIRAGDVVRADFDQLGSLTCRFRGSVHDAA